jgi:hypothetical protein
VNGRPDARHRARNVGGRRCGTFRKLCSVSLLSSCRFSHNLAQPQTALPKPWVAQIVGGRARPGEPHAGRPATPTIMEATGCLTWGPPHRAQPIQAGLQAEGELADAPSAISENVTIELAAILAVDVQRLLVGVPHQLAGRVVPLGQRVGMASTRREGSLPGINGLARLRVRTLRVRWSSWLFCDSCAEPCDFKVTFRARRRAKTAKSHLVRRRTSRVDHKSVRE